MEIIIFAACLWYLGWLLFDQQLVARKQLGRFKQEKRKDLTAILTQGFEGILARLGGRKQKKQTLRYQASRSSQELEEKLKAAGLESAADRGRFYLIRTLCYVSGLLIGVINFIKLPTYYATIFTLMAVGISLVVPLFWLRTRVVNRGEDIERELPLFLDLTNLGTSAGWDLAASMERVIDALNLEFPGHPLVRELHRSRLLVTSGYTWNEALARLGRRLPNDSVRRSTLALGQALKQGGDRTEQLEGIAKDAQAIYYSTLDKRLATLPVKAIVITMLLMVSYFIILLAPAAVQVKHTLFNSGIKMHGSK